MEAWIVLGLLAGMLTTVGFVPQIIKGYRTRRMEDISLVMPILLSMGMTLWLCYGLVLNDLPIIFWNAMALVLNLIIILMKVNFTRDGAMSSDPPVHIDRSK